MAHAPNQNTNPSLQMAAADTTISASQTLREQFSRSIQARITLRDTMAARRTRMLLSPNLQFDITKRILGGQELAPIRYPEWYRPAWEREFYKRAHGGSENLLLSPELIRAAFTKIPRWERSKRRWQNDFIPSDLQLHVLKTLWSEGIATQTDIYLNLDTLYAITAEKLNQQLDRMVKIGLVERRLISPQHLFTIISPIRQYQIEMSAKNRKNRVYLYRPRVDKKQILQFLLARSYLVRNGEAGSPEEEKRLTEKIKILLPDTTGNH